MKICNYIKWWGLTSYKTYKMKRNQKEENIGRSFGVLGLTKPVCGSRLCPVSVGQVLSFCSSFIINFLSLIQKCYYIN